MVVEITKPNVGAQSVLYYCHSCSTNYSESLDLKSCPMCESLDENTMVKIYIEDDPELDNMYTKSDWLAGD